MARPAHTEAARAQGMELQILCERVLRYNAEGFEGLTDVCWTGWQWLLDQPDVITKTTRCSWAVTLISMPHCISS